MRKSTSRAKIVSMSLDNFTKHQVVLLILLFVIVTAVATSIATVSLLNDGTTPVSQTIYRVVEKTIEKVTEPSSPATIISIPKPSVPSSVLSPANIAERGASNLVRIYRHVGEEKKFIAIGIVPFGRDMVVTADFQSQNDGDSGYFILDAQGKEVKVVPNKFETLPNLYYFGMRYDAGEKKIAGTDLKGIDTLKIGSDVIALGGKDENNVVSTGIIREIRSLVAGQNTKDIFSTDIILSTPYAGFILFDSNGNLLGIWDGVNADDKTSYYLNAKVIRDAVAGIK